MRRFNDISIKRKLTVMIMGTAAAALLLACASFLVYEFLAVPRSIAQTLSSIAAVSGNNSAAAIVSNDHQAASETLSALRASPNITAAYLLKRDGNVFAQYHRDGKMPAAPNCSMGFIGYRLRDNRVEICRAISFDEEPIGSIGISADLSEMTERLSSYGQIVLLVLFISLGVAYLISGRIQRVVSAPILQLAGLARTVSKEQNYSVRAKKQTPDEIGALVDGFNAMLSQIEKRDQALQQAHLELEKKVADLQREVGERLRVEQGLAKRTVELQRSNAELEQFASVASHDLQEPLRMVSSYTQLLAKRYGPKLDGDAHEFIAFAVDGVKRMQTLIQDLLQFSRVGTRGKELGPVDCEAVVQTVLLNLASRISESGAVLRQDALPSVQGDDGQLVQLFQNLIGNALKYRGEKMPEIHIGCERQEDSWLFSIKDNGIGIDPQFGEKIFVLFQRLHGKGEYEGTGIGLAVCKKIVERHGGKIWVESAAGQGATFKFTLYRADPLVMESEADHEQRHGAAHAYIDR